jgi:hypothetical protein
MPLAGIGGVGASWNVGSIPAASGKCWSVERTTGFGWAIDRNLDESVKDRISDGFVRRPRSRLANPEE